MDIYISGSNNRIVKNSLMLLVENNCIDDIKSYVEIYPPSNNDDIKTTAFLFACRSGKLEIAKILLEYVSPNCHYSDGQTALMLISQLSSDIRGIMDFVDLLIIKGCEIDLVDFCGKSALHWATLKNSVWAVRTLIGYKCHINCVDLHGFTPLIYAAKLNFSNIVSILLHYGADPTKSSKPQGTAIHQAVRSHSSSALKQLIPFYRHLNILDFRNQSPIDLAVLFNNDEIVSILLSSKKEIEVNRRPSFAPFRTPLEQACYNNNLQIINALISAGAHVNYPLEFAFDSLTQNARSSPVSPLMFAVRHQNVDLVNLLLSNGIDVSVRCPKSPGYDVVVSPLTLAAELGNKEIIRLLEGYVAPSKLCDIGDTFIAACFNHDVSIVKDLITRYNIDVGQQLLKNGAPAILELFRDSVTSNVTDDLLLDLFEESKDRITGIICPQIAEALSQRNFGSSMQFYRCAWLKLAEQFPSHLMNVPLDAESSYIKFIGCFLECLFLKRKTDDFNLMNHNLGLLDAFSQRLIRWAIHSSYVIKSILLSKSFYALAVLVDLHFDENLAFWDQNHRQPMDLCEYSLFFDNIDAALVLNLSCGLSLKCISEYNSWPYIPEVMNGSIEYNDAEKITAIKYLSRTVKPLKTLCKYAVRRFVPNDFVYNQLSVVSASVMSDLTMELSSYICDLETGLYPLCKWAAVDPSALNLIYF